MKERPILFSGEMVRAILEGRKTQTRRVVKPMPSWQVHSVCKPDGAADPWAVWFHYPETDRVGHLRECPYGKPGDRLWVRETYTVMSTDGNTASVAYRERLPKGKTLADTDGGVDVIRLSTEELIQADRLIDCENWHPSIHMPRWASRISLEITDVRVQRLQEITEEDCIAEGIGDNRHMRDPEPPSIAFADLWESINGKGSWDANPWVWALTFKQVTA